MKKNKEEKRYVFGSRTQRWHEISKNDRDWKFGKREEEIKALTESNPHS